MRTTARPRLALAALALLPLMCWGSSPSAGLVTPPDPASLKRDSGNDLNRISPYDPRLATLKAAKPRIEEVSRQVEPYTDDLKRLSEIDRRSSNSPRLTATRDRGSSSGPTGCTRPTGWSWASTFCRPTPWRWRAVVPRTLSDLDRNDPRTVASSRRSLEGIRRKPRGRKDGRI